MLGTLEPIPDGLAMLHKKKNAIKKQFYGPSFKSDIKLGQNKLYICKIGRPRVSESHRGKRIDSYQLYSRKSVGSDGCQRNIRSCLRQSASYI